jgi:hypothetical protein
VSDAPISSDPGRLEFSVSDLESKIHRHEL